MKCTSRIAPVNAFIVVPLALTIVTACAGGGGSSPSPQPTPTLGGSGSTIALDQQVNFTVVVPPATTAVAIANARRKRAAARTTQAANNPYVSPNTASVTLQLNTVNGLDPKVLPAPITVNIACPGTTGCSVPIQNVQAATGIDRFSVITFASAGGVGNKLSASFVDVTVPSTQATSFGGTALTVGGFVQSISLALNIPGNAFYWHAPAAGTVDVNALDASGAIIIGSDMLANPIQLSLPSADAGAFTITGLQQIALQQPAQSLPLAYDGSILLAATVSASTTDENSQPFATSIPIPVGPPTPIPTLPPSATPPPPAPTPTPTLAPGRTPPPPVPTPPPRPQFSLYVYDASADRIIEYAGINAVETGQPLSATPRRVFEVAAPSAAITCPAVASYSPSLTDIAVSSTGTIYGQTLCTDTATTTLSYTFAYAASTQEVVPPPAQGTPAPPLPNLVFAVNAANYPQTPNVGSGIALDEAHNQIWLQYGDLNGQAGYMFGVQLNNPMVQTASFGSVCLQEYQEDVPCTTNSATGFIGSPFNFAVDANGFLYIPNLYGQYLSDNATAYTPPGSPAEQSGGEPAITVFSPGTTGQAPTPFSVLAGFHDDLGSNTVVTDAIEGSTLYSLVNGAAPITNPANSSAPAVYPGLSGCNDPPTSAAIPDSLSSASCLTGSGSQYLVGYANATQTLNLPGSQNTDVVAPPTFELGGDVVGGFGGGSSVTGDLLAVHNGFAYVLNATPPNGSFNSEVDVYNLNGVTGFHTDIQPITRLVFDQTITPLSIAIGPTGTGLGGQALLRRPARVHHNIRAWAAHVRQLRLARQQQQQQQQQQRRALKHYQR